MKLKDYKDKIKGWPEKLDQSEIAKKFCLLQPCEIQKDEATGGCYGCKIGSSIKNTFDQALDIISNLEFNPAELLDVDKVEEELKSVCLKITPNFNGLIFIQDNYHTPPNNWTRIPIKTLARAIVDSRDIIK